MKKILLMLFSIILLMAGCESADVDNPSVPGEVSESGSSEPDNLSIGESSVTDTVIESDLEISAQYIRTNACTEFVEFPSAVIINSRSELDTYYNDFKDVFYLGHVEKVYSDTTIGFSDACEKYGSEYFTDKYLVFIRLEEGSGSIRHEVTGVFYSNGNLDVKIDSLQPSEQTCDMAAWHIILELDKKYAVSEIENINIEVKTVHL